MNLDLNDRKGKNKELKTKYKELKEDLKRLERISSVPSESYNFTEAKVIDLWILAKKANFSDEELESLKVSIFLKVPVQNLTVWVFSDRLYIFHY